MIYKETLEKFKEEFDILDIGYTEENIPITREHYESWIENSLHGPLGYLTGERMEKRLDLRNYYPEFQSALVFLFSYQRGKIQEDSQNDLKICGYVSGFDGVDYHIMLRDRLSAILDKLKSIDPEIDGKFSLDTQPILERDMAYRAGLGWFGKNAMMINRHEGSYFIIGSLLLNKKIPMEKKEIETDHCGTCRRCIDACPTGAIVQDRVIDTSLCISTFTIELFKDTKVAPEGFKETKQLFGCDICQEVCPWNKKPIIKLRKSQTQEKEEVPIHEFFLNRDINEIIEDLEGMTNRGFRRKFQGTPMERTGRVGILKNLKSILEEDD